MLDKETLIKLVESSLNKELTFPSDIIVYRKPSMSNSITELIIHNNEDNTIIVIPANGMHIRKYELSYPLETFEKLGAFRYAEKDKQRLIQVLLVCVKQFL